MEESKAILEHHQHEKENVETEMVSVSHAAISPAPLVGTRKCGYAAGGWDLKFQV